MFVAIILPCGQFLTEQPYVFDPPGMTRIYAVLTAVGVKHGDLVIVPTFTFIASANAVRHCGADPWLMDIDAFDWCLDPQLVRDEIEKNCERVGGSLIHKPTGKRIAALMPVYTLGNIPDMKAFRALADEYEVPLVVDAACAIGATYNDQAFGTLADLSVLSFNGNKTVTCGGGGAVVYTVDQDRSEKQRWGEKVRHLTTTARVWPDYDFDEVGFNYRMTNIQAAVGCAQMERLDSFINVKRSVRQWYERMLEPLTEKGITFFPATNGSSCWFSGIVLPEGSTLDNAKNICGFMKERQIECKPFWKPVHLQRPYQECPKSKVTVAESLWQRIITLPCSTNISEEEIGQVCEALKAAL